MAALAVPLAKGIATAGASALLSKAFGGGSSAGARRLSRPGPNNIATPGFNIRTKGGVLDVTRSAGLGGSLADLRAANTGLAGGIGGLLPLVKPGFSALRASRLEGLETNRSRTIGDLRENLARRRISGSSFANDAVARAELGFQREGDRVRAETALSELDATLNLLNQQAGALSRAAAVEIDQSNFEATLGANFANGVAANATAAAATLAKLEQNNALLAGQGAGAAFGPAVDAFGSAAGDFVSGLFSGGSA